MPDTKITKITTTEKKPKKFCIFMPISLVLTIITIVLAITTITFAQKQKTHEEEKRLQFFESLLEFETGSQLFTYEKNIQVKPLSTGLSEDDDLYISFKFIKFDDDNIPLYINTGKVYYPCGELDGKVIGVENYRLCGKSYDPGKEPVYFSEADREAAREYQNKVKEIEAKIAKVVYGDENCTYETCTYITEQFTEEQYALMDQYNTDLLQAEEEYSEKFEKFWDYL